MSENIMERKLRILAASDIHGDSSQFRKLAEKAEKENIDLVILCGDITSPLQGSNIIKPFKEKGKKVMLVPGNHDGLAVADFLSRLYSIRNLHGDHAVYYNIGFFGCGLANVGLDALPEKDFYDTLKKGFLNIRDTKKKIMVTHIHPHGTIVDKIEPGFGSTGVRRAIDAFKPDLVLCGHVHSAAGVEDFIGNTKVVNVGREGKIFEL